MAGFLDEFRKKVIASVWKDSPDEPKIKDIDDRIALGVLLWVVAEADGKFLPEEDAQIKEVLKVYGKIPDEDIPAILGSVKQAAAERIDIYRFTREVSQGLPYEIKLSIITHLFRVACADKDLDNRELEAIREIAGLLRIAHRDFIDAKIQVKKEFGLETV